MKKNKTTRQELNQYIHQLLAVDRFKDYCPNGLQVEGREEIRRLVCGVTANQALLDLAIAEQADAILVHHGWFWKGEDPRVRGTRKARLAALLKHDINLLAYHLPLDAHPVLGNNAQLARVLGLTPAMPATLNPSSLVWHGTMPGAITLEHIARSNSSASEELAAAMIELSRVADSTRREIAKFST